MPIRIPDSLPAHAILEAENIFVMTEHRAMHQDIRPLNVLILNLICAVLNLAGQQYGLKLYKKTGRTC